MLIFITNIYILKDTYWFPPYGSVHTALMSSPIYHHRSLENTVGSLLPLNTPPNAEERVLNWNVHQLISFGN